MTKHLQALTNPAHTQHTHTQPVTVHTLSQTRTNTAKRSPITSQLERNHCTNNKQPKTVPITVQTARPRTSSRASLGQARVLICSQQGYKHEGEAASPFALPGCPECHANLQNRPRSSLQMGQESIFAACAPRTQRSHFLGPCRTVRHALPTWSTSPCCRHAPPPFVSPCQPFFTSVELQLEFQLEFVGGIYVKNDPNSGDHDFDPFGGMACH